MNDAQRLANVISSAHLKESHGRIDRAMPELAVRLDDATANVWGNPGLSRRERRIVTIALLAADGRSSALRAHLRAALADDVHLDELQALAEQIAVYAGLPAARNVAEALDDAEATPSRTQHVDLPRTLGRALGAGDGEPFLLLPPVGLDRRTFASLLPLIAACRAIAIDLPGFGDAPYPTPLTMTDNVAHVIAILDHLGFKRVHLAGVSYGGAVAQALALAHPNRVSSLVLAATFSRGARDLLRERARSARDTGIEAQIPATLVRWFSAECIAANRAEVRYARERLRTASLDAWCAAWEIMAEFDVTRHLSTLRIPTTVIVGENDVSTLPSAMRELAAAIPGARFEVIPGGVHLLPLENGAALGTSLTFHVASAAAASP